MKVLIELCDVDMSILSEEYVDIDTNNIDKSVKKFLGLVDIEKFNFDCKEIKYVYIPNLNCKTIDVGGFFQ